MSGTRMLHPIFQFAFNKKYLREVQYAGMRNYQNRKSDVLLEWYAQQYKDQFDLTTIDRILEVGCGDGDFWKHAVGDRPFKPKIVMTDLVEKMLAHCKDNLSPLKLKAHYQPADIDSLPFKPASFTAVLAHKVIYHAENPEQAIAGFQQVLKPNGFLGLAVLNQGAYQSIWRLANSINPDIPDQSLTVRFNNVDANETLPRYFPEITTRTYTSTRKFVDSEAVVEYVRTHPNTQSLRLSDNFFGLFRAKVKDEIKNKGSFDCEYNSNLYLCRKKNR